MVEFGEQRKQEKELSLGGFSVGGCRKQGRRRRRSKMKGERRRGGIYRIWVCEVMQINKGEGVFVKWGDLMSLGHLAGHDEEKGVGWLGNDNLERKHLMKREKGG